MNSNDNWEDRYKALSEALESERARHRQERFTLQRLLTRTCVAAEGQGPGLDFQLGELRELVRSDDLDISSLKRLQDRLDALLDELDSSRGRSQVALERAVIRLIQVSRRMMKAAGLKAEYKKLRERAPFDAENSANLAEWIEQFAELYQRADRVASSPRRGLFGFMGGGDVHETADASDEAGESDEMEDDRSDPVAGSAGDEAESDLSQGPQEQEDEQGHRVRLAARIVELLDHVLKHVLLPESATEKASDLRKRLTERASWQDLRDALNDIADLLIAAVSRIQAEFEAFLRRLDERLAQLQESFAVQAELRETQRSDAKALDNDLNLHLETLGSVVSETDDISTLKQSVNQHVKAISGAFQEFRSRETEREEQLERQLEQMQEKLAGMEAYSEEMRERVQEERRHALTDRLTELPNREAWQERLELEFQRWQRYQNPAVLAVLDIDHFKRVNDSWGHRAGDRVIRLVGRALRDRLRNTDFVARYGGEEFVVLLPETSLLDGIRVIDEVREQITQLPFHFQKQPVRVTVSAGLIDFGSGSSTDDLFDAADKALYEAKDAGRNQVKVASR